jgi:pimeloyl-ACP methyl ester carboxylesterase
MCSCAAWEAIATGRSCGLGSGTAAWWTPNASRPTLFAEELPALAAWTFGPAAATRVGAPALLICRAESRPGFRENLVILAEMLPDVRTRTLPGLDHLAPLTRPGELASTIGEFVSHRAAIGG